MKTKLLIPAAILLAACTRTESECTIQRPEGEPCNLTVSLAGLSTKATVAHSDSEARIGTLQVFVFNEDNLDAYASCESSSSLTLSATTGERQIYAIVNSPVPDTIRSKAVLLDRVSDFLAHNADTNFVMVGHRDVTLGASNDITVNVSRIASRVRVHKISRDMSLSAYASLDSSSFEVTRMYLTNARGSVKLSLDESSQAGWLSSALSESSAISSNVLLYKEFSDPLAIAQQGSAAVPDILYCYPNACSADSESAKITRLVVEIRIDGQLFTYPICLGAVESNRSYEIKDLVITRPGNPSDGDSDVDPQEDLPVQGVSAQFTVVPEEWEQVFITSEGQEEGVFRI